MANSLINFTQQASGSMGAQISPAQLAQQGGMSMPQMLGQIKRFKNTIKGNPKQQVMQMVQQGMRSNDQLQQAMAMAQQFRGLF